jgi:hypothetical protein
MRRQPCAAFGAANFWRQIARRFVITGHVMFGIGRRISNIRRTARQFRLKTRCLIRENPMRRTILTVLGAMLISASSLEIAAAAEHHHVSHTHKLDRAAASEHFRRASNSVISPSVAPDYYEGHGLSAPAGRG